jgi:hypothetical protein
VVGDERWGGQQREVGDGAGEVPPLSQLWMMRHSKVVFAAGRGGDGRPSMDVVTPARSTK